MERPLVSVITPSYNQGRFIRATIESVLTQDYPNVEYIIMDGGSTDETASIAAEYSGRLKFISEKDNGQSHAINKGFRMARGQIVAWLNSDDVFLPGAISHAVRAMERFPRCGAVYGEGYILNEDGSIRERFPVTEPFNLWKLVYLSDYILQQTVYFRKSVLEEIGYLRENLHYGMDWDLLIRIGLRYPLAYVPEYLGCIREHEEAKSSRGGAERIRELRDILREHTGLRFPPGYIVYGLDTYARILRESIDEKTSRFGAPVGAVAKRLVNLVCGTVISRTIVFSQGLFPDGWVAPRMRYMMPPGQSRIRIRGHLPGNLPALKNQRLSVRINGKRAAEQTLRFGDFEIEVEVPGGMRDHSLNILVEAERSIVPILAGVSRDYRRISYRISSIDGVELAMTAAR